MNFELTAKWYIAAPLHVGTGLSRASIADRTVRLIRDPVTGEMIPVVPGDAVKGAVRGSAERLVRWLAPDLADEEEDHSLPVAPALRRIFRSAPGAPFYRLYPATYIKGGKAFTRTSTAIERGTGVAKGETLRTTQAWAQGSEFSIRIAGRGGKWDQVDSPERRDLGLLVAALVAVDLLGGKKGTGHGVCKISGLVIEPAGLLPDFTSGQQMTELRQLLLREGSSFAG